MGIRLATVADAQDILAIYAPIVAETTISFETDVPTLAEMQRRIGTTLVSYPWLVYEREDRVLGYVYGSKHRERTAYQWAADVSIYVHPQAQRGGVGRALYTSLFALLRLQGVYNLYAGIALPNSASVGIHETMGMRPVGVYEKVGYKRDGWYDVGWWQLALRERAGVPLPITPLSQLSRDAQWDVALGAGLSLLRG